MVNQRDTNKIKKYNENHVEYYSQKKTSKLNNEGNINSIRINDQVVYNQINITNKLNSYFSNKARNISNKRINEKEGANLIQNLFKYFNQPFKDIR